MLRRLVLVLLGVVGLSLAMRIAPYQVDDAYIAYRYAANLASGLGFAFNPGGPAVEGFTSPLWLLILSGLAKVASPDILPTAAMAVGLLSLLALLPLVGCGPGAAGLLASALCVLSPWAIFYSVSGLEPVLFAVLVLVWALAVERARIGPAVLVAAVILPWVRPEAAWLPLVAAAQLFARDRSLRALLRPPTRTMLTVLVASTGALLVARLAVFGELLPNTYYAKPGQLGAGLRYLGTWLGHPHVATLFALALAGAVLGGKRERGYLAAALAFAVAPVIEGGDWMPQARLLMPSMALAALAAGGVVQPLAGGGRRRRLAVELSLGLGALCLVLGVREAWREGDRSTRSLTSMRSEDRALVELFQALGVGSVAMVDIGNVGFAMRGLAIVDLGGLTDARIGHAPGPHLGKQLDLGYVFDERKPAIILTRVTRLPDRDARGRMVPFAEDGGSRIELALMRDRRMARDYEPLVLVLPQIPRAELYGRLLWRRIDFTPRTPLPRDVLLVGERNP
jgi:hypothetical protein